MVDQVQNLCTQTVGFAGNGIDRVYIAKVYCIGIWTRPARNLDKPTGYHPNSYKNQQASKDYALPLFDVAYNPLPSDAEAAPASQFPGPILPHLPNRPKSSRPNLSIQYIDSETI
jgi:hypothetical protein